MRRKLLLIILSTLFFTPLIFAESIKGGESKTVEIEKKVEQIDQKLEKTNTEFNNSLQKLEEDIFNRFDIREENLQFREKSIDWVLAILGIMIAVLGIWLPYTIARRSDKMTERHEKEIKKIEDEFKKVQEELDKKLAEVNIKVEDIKQIAKVAKIKLNEICDKKEEADRKVANIPNYEEKFTPPELLKKVQGIETKDIGSNKENAEFRRIINKVKSYINDNNLDEALYELGKAETFNIDDAEIYFYKARVFDEKNEYKKAVEMYDKVINILKTRKEPNAKLSLSYAYNNKGLTLSNMAEYEQALGMYTEAIKLNQSSLKALNNKGRLLLSLGRYNEAIDSLNKAYQKNKEYTHTHHNLVEAHLLKGDIKEAKAKFDEYLTKEKPYIFSDDYKRWMECLDKAINNCNEVETAKEMKKLIDDNIKSGKLKKEDRDSVRV